MGSLLAKSQVSHEVNFDGLIGPTHHFAGLAVGNIASISNKGRVSNPKRAALQGLKKMKLLHDCGVKQAVIPPVCRPDFAVLRNLGFVGSPAQVLQSLSTQPRELITAFFSASSMWTANSATVSPSADTEDGKVHITPANLAAKFHRSLESTGTLSIMKAIFSDEAHFKVHDPLFSNLALGDEGAANHTRFSESYGSPGVEFFVYGIKAFGNNEFAPKRFPARQALEASQAIARRHRLQAEQVVYGQQNPKAIDEGAFHNDVVAVGNQDLLFYHEEAFLNEAQVLEELQRKFLKVAQKPLSFLRVNANEVSLKEVVQSYLFNSQIIHIQRSKNHSVNSQTILLAPIESQESAPVRGYLESVVKMKNSPIQQVRFVDLRESMLNGGGPACLRLRVVLTEEELSRVSPGVFLDEVLFQQLEQWIGKHYRDNLTSEELCDPHFVVEVETALDELTRILKLGSIYSFQTS